MRTKSLLVLAAPTLFFLPVLAHADPTFDLTPAGPINNPIIAHPGQTLHFKGSLIDNDGNGIEILGDQWNIPYSGISINDSGYQNNFNYQVFGGYPGAAFPASGPDPLFDLTLSKTLKPQTYNMTFTINVTDFFNDPFTLTDRFFVKVTPASVPGPSSLSVALLGAACLGAGFAGKRRRLMTA